MKYVQDHLDSAKHDQDMMSVAFFFMTSDACSAFPNRKRNVIAIPGISAKIVERLLYDMAVLSGCLSVRVLCLHDAKGRCPSETGRQCLILRVRRIQYYADTCSDNH